MKILLLLIPLLATGCAFSGRAQEIRQDYAAEAYLQAVRSAEEMQSLAMELHHRDSPATNRAVLEERFRLLMEAANADFNSTLDTAKLQRDTVAAAVYYEAERAALEADQRDVIGKIDALKVNILGVGEAAARISTMADQEITVSQEALREFARTGLPSLAMQGLQAYVETRSALEVVDGTDESKDKPNSGNHGGHGTVIDTAPSLLGGK